MNQQAKRAALGIALGVIVVGGWYTLQSRAPSDDAMPSQAPSDDAMQSRTPIVVAALGPQVGELVPQFSLPDQNGKVRTLDDILGPRGALLLFHRSADW